MAAAYTTLVAYIVLAGAQVIFARKVHLKETGNKSVFYHGDYYLEELKTIEGK